MRHETQARLQIWLHAEADKPELGQTLGNMFSSIGRTVTFHSTNLPQHREGVWVKGSDVANRSEALSILEGLAITARIDSTADGSPLQIIIGRTQPRSSAADVAVQNPNLRTPVKPMHQGGISVSIQPMSSQAPVEAVLKRKTLAGRLDPEGPALNIPSDSPDDAMGQAPMELVQQNRNKAEESARKELPLTAHLDGTGVISLRVVNETLDGLDSIKILVENAQLWKEGQLVDTKETHSGHRYTFRPVYLDASSKTRLFADEKRFFSLTSLSNGRLMMTGRPVGQESAQLPIHLKRTGEWHVKLLVTHGKMSRTEVIKFSWDGQQVSGLVVLDESTT